MNSGMSLEDRIKQLQRQILHWQDQDQLHAIAAAGYAIWNKWFEDTPPRTTLDFKGFKFHAAPIDFSNFIFRAPEDGSACIDFSTVIFHKANKFTRATFETRALFIGASLGSDSNFEEAAFLAVADFKDANFGSDAIFRKVTFHGDANFTNTIFVNDAVFADATLKGKSDFTGGQFGNNADFSGTLFTLEVEFFGRKFGHQAKFNASIFHAHVNFNDAKFGLSCTFSQAEFKSDAGFALTTFSNFADFSRVQFASHADFSGAAFKDYASFQSSAFKGPADFVKSKFGDETNFRESIFHDNAGFQGASFGDNLDFGSATFRSRCTFQATGYGDIVGFEKTVFFGDADFSASIRGSTAESSHFHIVSFASAFFHGDVNFEGRKFKSTTRFGRAVAPDAKPGDATVFQGIPMFHGCELHQDTDLREASFQEDFPDSRGSDAARAYRTLKLAMEKLKATREEQRFFRLEMKAEHASLSRGKRWMSTLYSLFSDYGFSLWRPIAWLLTLSILFCTGYGVLADLCVADQECVKSALQGNVASVAERTTAVLKYTLASAAPVPGLDKMQTDLRAPLFGQHGWIAIASLWMEILHKIISLALTFLFALALRNLFKMKS